jgi:hypothetical protein
MIAWSEKHMSVDVKEVLIYLVYFYESNFQDKSIGMIFTFPNSKTLLLFMIYVPNV